MNKIQPYVKYDSNKIPIGIYDENGVYWVWSRGKLIAAETLDDPHSGYTCLEQNIPESLWLLVRGGYITQADADQMKAHWLGL